jgi:small subunit ribosomal protein S8
MLTRIRNANSKAHDTVEIPHSNLKGEVARILKKEGYIRDYTTEGHGGKRTLRVYLKYIDEEEPVIQGLKRVSKPGLRQYVGADEIPRVLRGMGIAIMSTSSGILTGKEARKRHVGGEVLCYVW